MTRLFLILTFFVVTTVFCLQVNKFSYLYYSSNTFNLNPRQQKTICYAKSKKSPGISEKAQQYIRMRDFRKLQDNGGTLDEMKEFIVNGTMTRQSIEGNGNSEKSTKSYQQFVGKKASLDARLRAIVAYKREGIASSNAIALSEDGMTKSEERELDSMMEDDNNDDDDGNNNEDEDEEEAEYESLVIKALEANKRNELQRNFLLDKAMRNDDQHSNDNNENITEVFKSNLLFQVSDDDNDDEGKGNKTSSGLLGEDEEGLYTPSRSSWGVFQRPKDISKTFGGGRQITRAEMDRMDQEWEERQKREEIETKLALASIGKKEKESVENIKSALLKSRNFMRIGNRQSAVDILQSVYELVSWHSDLGGEVLLEYAMALETVDRTEEARQIYGGLALKSWSQKIKGNAVGLLQGLEITRQIRKDKTPSKPFMDAYSMQMVSEALKPGLTNQWNEYDSKKKYSKVTPWYDDGTDSSSSSSITKIESLNDAYKVLLLAIDPLKQVSSEILNQAFDWIAKASEMDKMTLLRSRGLVTIAAPTGPRYVIPDYAMQTSIWNQSTSYESINTAERFNTVITQMTGGINPVQEERNGPTIQLVSAKKPPTKKLYNMSLGTSGIYFGCLNGTWDLVLSLTTHKQNFMSKSIARSKRYEYGDLRRVMITDRKSNLFTEEIFPVMWGLTLVKLRHEVDWLPDRCEIQFTGPKLTESSAPWQKKNQLRQIVQVIYCDDMMKLTKQTTPDDNNNNNNNSNDSNSSNNKDEKKKPELFTLWKRVLPTAWKKY